MAFGRGAVCYPGKTFILRVKGASLTTADGRTPWNPTRNRSLYSRARHRVKRQSSVFRPRI